MATTRKSEDLLNKDQQRVSFMVDVRLIKSRDCKTRKGSKEAAHLVEQYAFRTPKLIRPKTERKNVERK